MDAAKCKEADMEGPGNPWNVELSSASARVRPRV